ncbi:hypothetical protein J7M07_08205 [bacterium]|nr:hypothetical protein [bacterium]
MNAKHFSILLICLVVAISGCKVANVVMKDIPIQDMDFLEDKYLGRTAWTKAYIVDIGQNGVIEKDTKIKVVELDMHWTGAVGVKAPNNHKYRHALKLERPVTKESFEKAINELLWFSNPTVRYRRNLWKYGKEVATAILNHQLIEGMSKEAALESWGPPDEIEESQTSSENAVQWIYLDPRDTLNKSNIIFVNDIVTEWSE